MTKASFVGVSLFFLVFLTCVPLGLPKGNKWEKYKPYWCTSKGRTFVRRITTARQCRSHCGDGCEAVEWWWRGKRACYICKNLTLMREFRFKNDLSFPPIVFVKKTNGSVLYNMQPVTSELTLVTQPSKTKSLEQGPTTLSKERVTSISSDEGTTTNAATRPTPFLREEKDIQTPTTDEVNNTSSPDKTSISTALIEKKENQMDAKTSPPELQTTSVPDKELSKQLSTPKKKGKKWKKYKRFWCTPPGRAFVKKGTTARECRSYCRDGCEAIEWWRKGKKACYTCSNLTLMTRFPHKNDLSFPPIVFVKNYNGLAAIPTTVPVTSSVQSTSHEGIATSFPLEPITISFSNQRTAFYSSYQQGKATLSPQKIGPVTTFPLRVHSSELSLPGKERGSSSSGEGTSTFLPDEKATTFLPTSGETTSLSGKRSPKERQLSKEEIPSTFVRQETGERAMTSPLYEETTMSSLPERDEGATVQVVLPNSPRDVAAKTLSDTELEVTWQPPSQTGNLILSYEIEVKAIDTVDLERHLDSVQDHSFRVPGTERSHKLDSLIPDTRYKIVLSAENLYGQGPQSEGVYINTSKSFEARIEPLKPKEAERLTSCMSIRRDKDVYTLKASHGIWPHNGLCHVPIDSNVTVHGNYRVSASLFVPETKGSNSNVHLGIFFNAAAKDHFDFLLFRFGKSDGVTCFQSGVMRRGQLDWFGSQSGSCPHGSPYKARWIHSMLDVGHSQVAVFLDGVYVTSFEGHISLKASAGVVLVNDEGSEARVKEFTVSKKPAVPFYTTSCASLQYQKEYYSLISQNDVWSRGFCRVLLKDTPVKDHSSYQISVDLYSEMDWSWDRIAFVGIIFNARDINNADFIYFRPFWKEHCYQTGYLLEGREMREASTTGHCPCTLKSGKWFNVRLEIRAHEVNVMMNNKHTATFKSYYQLSEDWTPGSGLLVTGGCRKSMRFRHFAVSSLPKLPFIHVNCRSARVAGIVFKLTAYSGNDKGMCRALYPKVAAAASNYTLSVNIHSMGSTLGGKYGVIFNAKNPDTFEFVYFRPYNGDNCVVMGSVKDSRVRIYSKFKLLSCGYGLLKSGNWYKIQVQVTGSEVKVLIDDLAVAIFKSEFEPCGCGGLILGSGVKRRLSFKDYAIEIQ